MGRFTAAPSDEGDGDPRGDLDSLLDQLVQQAEDVRLAQDRLKGLVRATRSIVSDLDLEKLLRRIVEVACDLIGARYGAMGVIAPGGTGLEQFIHVGVDDATVRRIGDLPEGKGLLGALIDDPHPIRLRDLAEDPRSVGFPAHHPPMRGFLGVPVSVRGRIFGNLYLAQPDRGLFSGEDEEIATSLAATAGVAIENARLFREASERQSWLEASTEVTRQLLDVETARPQHHLVTRLLDLAAADTVALVRLTGSPGELEVAEIAGQHAETFRGRSFVAAGGITLDVIRTGRAVALEDVSHDSTLLQWDGGRADDPLEALIGPVVVLPFSEKGRYTAAVVIGRRSGGHRFEDSLVQALTTFVGSAAHALELAEARGTQERLALLEDRARIARDLHDHVIQQLFAAGMTAQVLVPEVAGTDSAPTLDAVVDGIDDAIRQIRTSIFQLRPPPAAGTSLRRVVLDVVRESSRLLPSEPGVSFWGPVDAVADSGLTEDVVAVVRECLANVARHAEAAGVQVRLTASAFSLEVVVEDDGRGPGDDPVRSGLANLAARATARRGTCEVTTAQPTDQPTDQPGDQPGDQPAGEPTASGRGPGTRVRWSVPLS